MFDTASLQQPPGSASGPRLRRPGGVPAGAGGGFTLLEVLIVLVLLGVLAAVVWPDFGQARRSQELDESVRRMTTLIQMCRARAMNDGRAYRITFRTDGTIRVTRQRDPLYAPEQFVKFREPWAQMTFLLEHVWVESLLPLPEGPPPIDVDDNMVEFEEFRQEPTPIEELDEAFDLDFQTDGTSGSARWILRDAGGRGVQMTLDGRLGRVDVKPVESLDAEGLERPEAVEEQEEIPYEDELEPLEERP